MLKISTNRTLDVSNRAICDSNRVIRITNREILVRGPHSSYQTVVQGKCPFHFVLLNGVVWSNTLFSNTSALTSSLYSGEMLHARFSNTSFARTLLGSNFGGLLLEQTFCRHCAAFPFRSLANQIVRFETLS